VYLASPKKKQQNSAKDGEQRKRDAVGFERTVRHASKIRASCPGSGHDFSPHRRARARRGWESKTKSKTKSGNEAVAVAVSGTEVVAKSGAQPSLCPNNLLLFGYIATQNLTASGLTADGKFCFAFGGEDGNALAG
jgi:hypothetical protein